MSHERRGDGWVVGLRLDKNHQGTKGKGECLRRSSGAMTSRWTEMFRPGCSWHAPWRVMQQEGESSALLLVDGA
jgi:hypothetical protein